MINTPWHAKIDAHQLFYFVILSVGGTLIDAVVSTKARLYLDTDAHGTLIFDKYEECSSKNHDRTGKKNHDGIGEKDPVHQIYMLEPHCQVPSVARQYLTGSDMIPYLFGKENVLAQQTFLKDFCPGL